MKHNPKEDKVFKFILKYKESHDGNSPTIREICKACKISSTSVVDYYLEKLQSRKLIQRDSFQSRNINVVGGSWSYNQ